MGREGDSRGTTQIPRTNRIRLAEHFVLTNISLPYNAGIAVWTSCSARYHLAPRSPSQLKRELPLVSVEHRFQPMPAPL